MNPRKSLILALAAVLAIAAVVALTACEANQADPAQGVHRAGAGWRHPAGLPKGTVLLVPDIQAEWSKSGHADIKAMAFTDWNDANPPEVPATCARCHSSSGYQDYIGADGTPANKVDRNHPTGSVVDLRGLPQQSDREDDQRGLPLRRRDQGPRRRRRAASSATRAAPRPRR